MRRMIAKCSILLNKNARAIVKNNLTSINKETISRKIRFWINFLRRKKNYKIPSTYRFNAAFQILCVTV